jgi:short subunit dehydrogenase-like uncharacterized protein
LTSTRRSAWRERWKATAEREHDVVLFGATGFTGGLTAEYLARAGGGTRWALAGRNLSKLEAVRERLVKIEPSAADVELIVADVLDHGSMRGLAERAKVVITTVGPYINYGEPLVAACASVGTDYVDLTGEPEFVDLMWLRHHRAAASTGARLVHSCGFDSIPYDLGALFTVSRLPEDSPIRMEGYVRAGGTISGGTYHSAVHIAGRLLQGRRVAEQRRQLEGRPEGRTIKGTVSAPHHNATAGGWVVPAPTIDPITVLRSARALERYGPRFSYGHYVVTKRLASAAALVAGAGAVTALAQLGPTRNVLLKLKDPGQGPSAERRAKSWFKVRFAAHAGDPLGVRPRPTGSRVRHPASAGRRIVTEVTGGDPGYGETSKMLAEAALCLAHDELPMLSGQLTPAVAMGQALIDRLQRAGIRFAAVEGAEGA